MLTSALSQSDDLFRAELHWPEQMAVRRHAIAQHEGIASLILGSSRRVVTKAIKLNRRPFVFSARQHVLSAARNLATSATDFRRQG